MIGAYGEAVSRDIVVDKTELEDCRLFAREDVAKMAAKEHALGFWVPIAGTLSRGLIDDWLAATS